MPTITRVERQQKNPDRVSLFAGETFLMGLDAAVWAEAPFGIGDTVAQAALDELAAADARQRSRTEAFRYLGYRPRTSAQVRQRLQERGFSAAVAAETVKSLTAEGYLDDRQYAVTWLQERLRLRPRGRRGIRRELRRNGVDAGIIDDVLTEHYPDEMEPALALARRRLRRRVGPGEAPDRFAILQLIGPYLQRRGFATSTIHKAARELAQRPDLWQAHGS